MPNQSTVWRFVQVAMDSGRSNPYHEEKEFHALN
jgi:hypothetical protein